MSVAAIWGFLTSPLGKYAVIALLLVGTYVKGRIDGNEAVYAEQAAIAAKAQKRADDLAAELLAEQQKEKAVIERKVTAYVDRIIRVPITTECARSPAIVDAIDSVRDLYGAPAKSQPAR